MDENITIVNKVFSGLNIHLDIQQETQLLSQLCAALAARYEEGYRAGILYGEWGIEEEDADDEDYARGAG